VGLTIAVGRVGNQAQLGESACLAGGALCVTRARDIRGDARYADAVDRHANRERALDEDATARNRAGAGVVTGAASQRRAGSDAHLVGIAPIAVGEVAALQA